MMALIIRRRILFLDEYDRTKFLPAFDPETVGVPYTLLLESDLVSNDILPYTDTYKPSKRLLSAIRKTTMADEVDFVIIGNNLGAGIQKAHVVSPHMYSRTLIAWHPDPGIDPMPYMNLGINLFAYRSQLATILPELLWRLVGSTLNRRIDGCLISFRRKSDWQPRTCVNRLQCNNESVLEAVCGEGENVARIRCCETGECMDVAAQKAFDHLVTLTSV